MITRKRKNVLKYMVVFACILLCTSFFVVPVSAADGLTTSVFQIPIEEIPRLESFRVFKGGYEDWSYSNSCIFANAPTAKSAEKFADGVSYTYDWAESNQGVVSLSLGFSNFSSDPIGDTKHVFSTNDTVWIDPSSFIAFSDNGMFSLNRCRFALRESDRYGFIGSVVAYTDPFACMVSSNTINYVNSFDKLNFTFLKTVEAQALALCIEFNGSSYDSSNLTVNFLDESFTINYGSGTSANYPIYPGAGGGNEVDDLGSVEDQILSDSSAGMDQGLSVMGDLNQSISNLGLGNGFLLLLTRTMDKFLELPGLNGLIYVSLSLGLFGSLMGLAGSIISAGDRRAASAKREASRSNSKSKSG